MRILQLHNPQEIKQLMQDIKVDPYGIKIMSPKAIPFLVRLDSVSNITANILKQEMLSVGADAAVSRDALTGRAKRTDCLLMGSLAQFNRLNQKLNNQPFGLNKLGADLSRILNNYQKENFTLDLGGYKLNLGRRAHLMGILNLTPDSFSGDGLYASSLPVPACPAGRRQAGLVSRPSSEIVDFAQSLADDGADIIDVGGESSRPGAKSVSLKEELERTIPVIKALAKKIKVPVSIDTCKTEVAKQALDCGAAVINDITGLKNPRMRKLAAKYKAAVVIMHMKGNPRSMQRNPRYVSLTDEIIEYFQKAVKQAQEAGIDKEKIIIDPGIGFGKALEHNLEILRRLGEFKVLGLPILAGPSRKSFIGKILNAAPQERVFGTVAACVLAARCGAKILRVHDVKAVKEALKISEAIN